MDRTRFDVENVGIGHMSVTFLDGGLALDIVRQAWPRVHP